MKRPSPQKVVKGAKPDEITREIETDVEYRCTCCGHRYKKQEGYFNRSKSPIYNGNNNFMSICHNCVAELYEKYIRFYDGDEEAAAERICQITDTYFDTDIWAMSRKISESENGKSRNRFSVYISRLNLLNKNIGTTYSDTLIRRWEADVANAETVAEVEQNEDIETPAEVVRRFGTGFDAGDYESLQYEYQDWVDREGEPADKRQEELYVSISYAKLSMKKMLQRGDVNLGAATVNYRRQIDAATTELQKMRQEAEEERKLSPVGEMIRDIEEFCPADFYKDQKLYKDFDYLEDYTERFLTRPTRNLLTGSKEMDAEFSLSAPPQGE